MEFELIIKIGVAVLIPLFFAGVTMAFYEAQTRWEIRRERQFWANRNAYWIDGGAK